MQNLYVSLTTYKSHIQINNSELRIHLSIIYKVVYIKFL